ncbi:hypothetical protein VTO42DRAFT_8962 [Malbranchea cinnamomea]
MTYVVLPSPHCRACQLYGVPCSCGGLFGPSVTVCCRQALQPKVSNIVVVREQRKGKKEGRSHSLSSIYIILLKSKKITLSISFTAMTPRRAPRPTLPLIQHEALAPKRPLCSLQLFRRQFILEVYESVLAPAVVAVNTSTLQNVHLSYYLAIVREEQAPFNV